MKSIFILFSSCFIFNSFVSAQNRYIYLYKGKDSTFSFPFKYNINDILFENSNNKININLKDENYLSIGCDTDGVFIIPIITKGEKRNIDTIILNVIGDIKIQISGSTWGEVLRNANYDSLIVKNKSGYYISEFRILIYKKIDNENKLIKIAENKSSIFSVENAEYLQGLDNTFLIIFDKIKIIHKREIYNYPFRIGNKNY